MLIKRHDKCRICSSYSLKEVINLGEHYLHGLFDFEDFHPPTRKVPVELVRCNESAGGCGLVQLRHSIDPDILYSRYGYRSNTSNTMCEHLTSIALNAVKLIDNKNLPIKVLDIGCNMGYLLKQYPAEFEKIGVDPSDVGDEIKDIKNFKFINDCFPSNKLPAFNCEGRFEIITAIACLYDLNDPIDFLSNIKCHLKNQGVGCIEVSYWPEKMRINAIEEAVGEHVAFYNYQNLEHALKKVELKIFDVKLNSINGGSIQIWFTHKNCFEYDNSEGKKRILDIKFKEFQMALDTDAPFKLFKENCLSLKKEMQELFKQIKRKKQTVHILGASTKGNVLLQFLELDDKDIPYASERSPEKWGGKTLGTNIKMISEEESREMRPNFYFVLIWSFKSEIIKREVEYIKSGGSLIFPLPKLEVVNKDNVDQYL